MAAGEHRELGRIRKLAFDGSIAFVVAMEMPSDAKRSVLDDALRDCVPTMRKIGRTAVRRARRERLFMDARQAQSPFGSQAVSRFPFLAVCVCASLWVLA